MKSFILPVVLMLVVAPSAVGQVSPLTQNQWIQPTENGTLVGRVILPAKGGAAQAVSGAEVAILGRGGEILRGETETNANGEFVIRGVKPGVYALTARADFVFACCAMQVLDSDLQLPIDYPEEAEIAAANIDDTTVRAASIRYLPPNVKRQDVSMAQAELEKLAPRVCGENTFRVFQFRDGMKGRLHAPGAIGANLDDARLTNVFVMRQGLEVGRAVTNQRGEFVIKSLPPGQYSLMAIGPYGLGLIGLELVAEKAETSLQTTDGKRLIGAPVEGCREFAMQVAPVHEVISLCEETVMLEQPIADPCGCGLDPCVCGVPLDGCGCEVVEEGLGTPLAGGMCCGGGGGYGGGGGGGGGGSGGFGAIAGLAAFGGIIAVATKDDDDTIGDPGVATPIQP